MPLRLTRLCARGPAGLVLATLLLLARLTAPAMAMPADPLGTVPICHAGATDEAPPPAGHSGLHDCLLCPACHLLSHAVLPTPASPGVRAPVVSRIGMAAPLPPATGPPSPIRATAQPTGPPRLSA